MYSSDQIDEIGELFALCVTEAIELTIGSRWMGRRYRLSTDSGSYFLKVRSEWWPSEQAEATCRLLNELREDGLPIARLQPAASGGLFATWNGHICECHEFIEGSLLNRESQDELSEAGSTLALLHSSLRSLKSTPCSLPEGCGFPHPGHVAFFAKRVADTIPESPRRLDEIVPVLQDLSVELGAGGHGDYHPGNILVSDGAVVAVVDFDLSQDLPVAYDLGYFLYRAATVSGVSDGGAARLQMREADAFLSSYWRITDGLPTRMDVAREIERFALYDCLLEGSNSGDPNVFDEWVTDALELRNVLRDWETSD